MLHAFIPVTRIKTLAIWKQILKMHFYNAVPWLINFIFSYYT